MLACFASMLHAEIALVENGTSRYTLVLFDSASEAEREAAADFVETLEKISGANVPIGDASDFRIFIGRNAPSDRDPLGEGERRIKSEDNDIYIYGEGPDGTVFVLYDFLDRFLGCRWYFIWDMGWGIPRKTDIHSAALMGGTHFAAGGTQLLILDVDARKHSELELEGNHISIQAPVKKLIKGSVGKAMSEYCSPALKVHRAIPEREYTFTYEGKFTPAGRKGFVYIRTRQIDGQTAWISPIWYE